jgi:hypothetical protein
MDINNLGLDLLMNRKKVPSDVMSIVSRSSGEGDDVMSVRSISLPRHSKPVIRSIEPSENADDDDDDEEIVSKSDASTEVEEVNVQYQPKRKKQAQPQALSQSGTEIESLPSSANDYPQRLSQAEILSAKQELLYQFDRLEKKGLRLPRKFTMANTLEEMKNEYERLKKDRELDSSVKLQKKVMMAIISGVEYCNSRFDPFDIKLDGWSDSINENLDEYDDVFEELHEKYKGKAKMAPELRLLMMLGGSAFMFHMTNSMFKTSLPGMDQVLKQNPGLMKQFAAATADTMAQQNKGGPFDGLSSMFSGMFGGMGGGGGPPIPPQATQPPPMPSRQPVAPRPQMKGPSNMDEILRELEIPPINNDRIEMMSTVTESELGDEASINGLLMNKKRAKRAVKQGITLTI